MIRKDQIPFGPNEDPRKLLLLFHVAIILNLSDERHQCNAVCCRSLQPSHQLAKVKSPSSATRTKSYEFHSRGYPRNFFCTPWQQRQYDVGVLTFLRTRFSISVQPSRPELEFPLHPSPGWVTPRKHSTLDPNFLLEKFLLVDPSLASQ